MNCANCLESEDDRHDSFVCEECQASSIDDAVEFALNKMTSRLVEAERLLKIGATFAGWAELAQEMKDARQYQLDLDAWLRATK